MSKALFQFLTVAVLAANHAFADVLVQPGYPQPQQHYSPVYVHRLAEPTEPRKIEQSSNFAIHPAVQTFRSANLNYDQPQSHIVGNPFIRYRYIPRPPLHHLHTTRLGGYKILEPSWIVGHQYGPTLEHRRYRRSINDKTADEVADENGDVAKKQTLAENSTALIDSQDTPTEAADDSNDKRIEVRQSKDHAMLGMFYNLNSDKIYPGFHKYRAEEIPFKSDDLSQEKTKGSIPITPEDQPKNDLSKDSTSNKSDSDSRNVRSHHSTPGTASSQHPTDSRTSVSHEMAKPAEKSEHHQNTDQVPTQSSHGSHQIPPRVDLIRASDLTARNLIPLIYEDGTLRYQTPPMESQGPIISSPIYVPYRPGQRNFPDPRPLRVSTPGSSSMPMSVSIPTSVSMQQAHQDAAKSNKMLEVATPNTVENMARTHHVHYAVHSPPPAEDCSCHEESFSCADTCDPAPTFVVYSQSADECGCNVAPQVVGSSSYRTPVGTPPLYRLDNAPKPRYIATNGYGSYVSSKPPVKYITAPYYNPLTLAVPHTYYTEAYKDLVPPKNPHSQPVYSQMYM